MKKVIYVFKIIIIAFIASNNVFAVFKNIDNVEKNKKIYEEENKPKEVLKRELSKPMNEFLSRVQNIKTITANFVQYELSNTDNNNKKDSLKGYLRLSKPNKLYWKITSPEREKQLYVTNGDQVWHYDVALEQVVVDKFDQNKITTSPLYILLEDIGNIPDHYKITNLGPDSYKLELNVNNSIAENIDVEHPELELNKNNQNNVVNSNYVSNLIIEFKSSKSHNSRVINKISFTAGGSKTIVIELSNVSLNPSLSRASFGFVAPNGVDVIDAKELI